MSLACCSSGTKEWERKETANLEKSHSPITRQEQKTHLLKEILVRSTSMIRKSLIEAVSPEARDFIEAGSREPQFVQAQPEKAEGKASPALVPEPAKVAIDPAEGKEIPVSIPVLQEPADEIPSSVHVPETFRVPQQLIEELARAGELRALSWLDREGNIWLPIS